ncbi:MAG: hypothetical protein U0871_02390 [Gemmataceae bacterium]
MGKIDRHGLAVGAAWGLLTAGLLVFVVKFGRNIPAWEEWFDLPVLFGDDDRGGWVVGRLQEHRYVLGRAVLLTAFELSGRDFRAGMVLSVAALSAAALVLVRTAARVRGRPHAADALLPAVLLNPGGAENLILGYQVAFTLAVLLAALMIRLAATADDAPPARTGAAAGLLIGLLALSGWVGLAFVPVGVGWVALLAWRVYRSGGGRGRALALLVLPATAAGYFVWSYLDIRRNPLPGATTNPPAAAARVWCEFVSTAFGPIGQEGWPGSGGVAVGLLAVVVGGLAAQAATPPRRASAVGWLAVIGAVGLMGYGVASRRTSGFAPRNFHLTALLVAVAYLTVVRSVPARRWVSRLAAAAAVAFGGLVVSAGWVAGVRTAAQQQIWNDFYTQDRLAGLPLEYLASRRQLFPYPGFRDAVRSLRAYGHPAGAGIPDGPPVEVVPLPLPPPGYDPVPGDPLQASVLGRPAVWRFDLGGEQTVIGLRVRFRYGRDSVQVPVHVLWPDRSGQAPGTAVAGCFPWLIPGVWELDFWVNARTSVLWLRPLYAAEPIELLDVHLLRPLAPNPPGPLR